MNQTIRVVLVWLIKRCFKPESRRVYIEGGLGSQILAVMQYLTLNRISPNAILDASYFSPRKKPTGTATWGWELSEYGIPVPVQENRILTRVKYASRPRTIPASNLNLEVWREISDTRFNAIFPLHQSTDELLQELNIDRSLEYAAIHIRRGDYLTVSSKLLQLEDFGRIIENMSGFFQRRVLVFSDDSFTTSDKELIEKYCPGEVTFISGMNQHAVHGAMRLASVLLTSNSTYSLTAALLSEHPSPIIISPTQFFSDKERDINILIQQLSKWMLVVRPKNGI